MNRSKQNRRLRSFWYKKDLDGWVNFKSRLVDITTLLMLTIMNIK